MQHFQSQQITSHMLAYNAAYVYIQYDYRDISYAYMYIYIYHSIQNMVVIPYNIPLPTMMNPYH